MRAVALSDRGRPVLSVADGVGAVLYKDDPVESLQPPPELQVDFALNVHEDESSSKANRHHDELGPERPIQHPYGIERGQTHQRCVCNDSMALNNSTILSYSYSEAELLPTRLYGRNGGSNITLLHHCIKSCSK